MAISTTLNAHRHIPFGPDPPIPTLSPRSLRLAYNLLITFETPFLQRLPDLYPSIAGERVADHSIAFEVLAFLAGLKKCVVIGWGDGRTEEGKVGKSWVEDVWEGAKRRLRKANGLDEDVVGLLRFMDGCVPHRLGNVAGKEAIFTGHIALFHPPAGAALKTILNAGTFNEELVNEATINFDESLWAHVLNYPTVMPDKDSLDKGLHQMITLGVVYRETITMGTQYLALTTPSDENLCRAHWRRYRERLGEALDGLDIAISWDGTWEFPLGSKREFAPTYGDWWAEISEWTLDVLDGRSGRAGNGRGTEGTYRAGHSKSYTPLRTTSYT